MNEIINIKTLIQDDRNNNKGKKKGKKLLKTSIDNYGAGRSILIDKNNRIIAGNKTTEQSIASGITEVIVVQTTGNQLVAVQRTDIDLDSKEGRELAIADNVVAQHSIELNNDVMFELQTDFGLDLKQFDIQIADNQLSYQFNKTDQSDYEDDGSDDDEPEEKTVKRDTRGVKVSETPAEHEESLFPVSVLLAKNDLNKWKKYKEQIGVKADSQAFIELLNSVV